MVRVLKVNLLTKFHGFVQKISSHAMWEIETFIEEHVRNIVHGTMMPQSCSKVGTLGPHTVLSIAISCPIVFSWISSMVWNLFPFKGDFSFGKSQKSRASNLGCRGPESPGWFDVSPKNSAQDRMHEQARCCDEAANHQLPIVVAFWVMEVVSMLECSSLTQNLCRFFTQSFWIWRPHNTHAHSIVSTAPTDLYSEVVIVHTCAFQSTLLSCQVTPVLHKANCSCYISNAELFQDRPHIVQYH